MQSPFEVARSEINIPEAIYYKQKVGLNWLEINHNRKYNLYLTRNSP